MNNDFIQIFIHILNTAYQAGTAVCIIIIARFLLNALRVPKKYICFLWFIPFLRLALPVCPQSSFSLLPKQVPAVQITSSDISEPVIQIITGSSPDAAGMQPDPMPSTGAAASYDRPESLMSVLSIVWAVGICIFALYGIVSAIHLKRKLCLSMHKQDNIYLADGIPAAFVFGIVKPRIYLPSNISGEFSDYVICHEQTHINRKDHITKLIFFALTCIYWFHPLIWTAYHLANKDIEFACDEAVIRSESESYRQSYALALLALSAHDKKTRIIPLAFSERSPKKRIQHIIAYKKPLVVIAAAGAAAVALLSVGLLTNPITNAGQKTNEHTTGIAYGDETAANKNAGSLNPDHIDSSDTNHAERLNQTNAADPNTNNTQRLNTDGSDSSNTNNTDSPDTNITGNPNTNITDTSDTNNTDSPDANITDSSDANIISSSDTNRTGSSDTNRTGSSDTNRTGSSKNDSAPDSMIEIKAPVIDLSASTGADGVRLYYVDKNKIIFGGYFGLFVYSKTSQSVIRALDLEPIGCSHTQGEDACQIFADRDGSTVYLHPMNSDDMYIYSTAGNTLKKVRYNLTNIALYDGIAEDMPSGVYKDAGKDVYCLLREKYTIGSISWSENDSIYRRIFVPEGYENAVCFEPEDLHDLVKIEMFMDGRMRSCQDPDALQWLEKHCSSADMEVSATACPFYDPMYLTRADGTIGIIYPASDSCNIIQTAGGYYKYNGTNEAFWALFGDWREKLF